MASKSKKPAESNDTRKERKTPFFKNEKFRFVLGLIIFLIAIYILIAFISFLFYGAADQSKLDLKFKELMMDREIKVLNNAGKAGAYISEIVINKGFGQNQIHAGA